MCDELTSGLVVVVVSLDPWLVVVVFVVSDTADRTRLCGATVGFTGTGAAILGWRTLNADLPPSPLPMFNVDVEARYMADMDDADTRVDVSALLTAWRGKKTTLI